MRVAQADDAQYCILKACTSSELQHKGLETAVPGLAALLP
jgi:hypothetical protein